MGNGNSQFTTTVWSRVLLAAHEPDSAEGRSALSELCRSYWYPVYSYFRRQGHSPADAEDLTQGFFGHILSRDFLTRADPERGRFRNFLLGAARHYLANQREKDRAARRGGGNQNVPIDSAQAEHWLSAESSPTNDSSKAFDRAWATTILHDALRRLEEEQKQTGRAHLFEPLKEFIQRPALPGEYEQLALSLKMTKGAVAVAVHRLNDRFGELVRKRVRETVVHPELADEEMRFLFSALQA
jgi:RNA polymerase sigma factor (sigma-70 family)